MTLIELVVATAVLVAVAAGVTVIATRTVAGNTVSSDRGSALALATDKIEELRRTKFDALAAGSDGLLHADGSSGGIFSRLWSVSNDPALLGSASKTIAVTVSWNQGSITLATRVVEIREEAPGFPLAVERSWDQIR